MIYEANYMQDARSRLVLIQPSPYNFCVVEKHGTGIENVNSEHNSHSILHHIIS